MPLNLTVLTEGVRIWMAQGISWAKSLLCVAAVLPSPVCLDPVQAGMGKSVRCTGT